jgi:predicted transcriptional regulator
MLAMSENVLESASLQFIELSNDLRINMLLTIFKEGKGKISEIAKNNAVPVQEVARNFKRMTDAGLILKNSNGEYRLTRIGDIACHNIPSFIFMNNNKKYFITHDFDDIPIKFIQRIGAFMNTELICGVPIVLDRWKSIYKNAATKINVMSSEIFDAEFVNLITQNKEGNVQASYILSSDTIMPKQRTDGLQSEVLHRLLVDDKINRRMIKKIRTIVILNDNEAMVMFPTTDGRADMRDAFYGTDPDFVEWCKDYFEDTWKKGESFRDKKIKYFEKKYYDK